jgi:hypothetical protein
LQPHIKVLLQFLSFHVWLISISTILSSRFMHVLAHQNFIPFPGWIIFHCVTVPYLFLHSSMDGQLCCFHLWLW